MNHVSHGDDTATPACAARSMQRRFCAAAVRNRLELKLDTCAALAPLAMGTVLAQNIEEVGHNCWVLEVYLLGI